MTNKINFFELKDKRIEVASLAISTVPRLLPRGTDLTWNQDPLAPSLRLRPRLAHGRFEDGAHCVHPRAEQTLMSAAVTPQQARQLVSAEAAMVTPGTDDFDKS